MIQRAGWRALVGVCLLWSCGTLGQQTNFNVELEMVFHENIDGLGGRQAQNRWRIKDPWTVLSALEFVYYDEDLDNNPKQVCWAALRPRPRAHVYIWHRAELERCGCWWVLVGFGASSDVSLSGCCPSMTARGCGSMWLLALLRTAAKCRCTNPWLTAYYRILPRPTASAP